MARLERCREIANIPFVLTSAYRSPSYEVARGRSGQGAHTKGRAVDIMCTTSESRFVIVQAAILACFPRIGVGSNFVHLDDCSECLPSPRVWLY